MARLRIVYYLIIIIAMMLGRICSFCNPISLNVRNYDRKLHLFNAVPLHSRLASFQARILLLKQVQRTENRPNYEKSKNCLVLTAIEEVIDTLFANHTEGRHFALHCLLTDCLLQLLI